MLTSLWIVALCFYAFAFIVINERFKSGLPWTFLTFQTLTFLGGLLLMSEVAFAFGLAALTTSAFAGTVGFAWLWFDEGPNVFTQTLLPGMKG